MLLTIVQIASALSSLHRVPPAAVVGCSGAGKTQALMEFVSELQDRGDDATFVSFGGDTPLSESSALESFLARLAMAQGLEAKSKEEMRSWLAGKNMTVVIDNLDAVLAHYEKESVEELVTFLEEEFTREGCYYAFSSLLSSTVDVIDRLGGTGHTPIFFSKMTGDDQREAHPAYYACLPGLAVLDTQGRLQPRWESAWDLWERTSLLAGLKGPREAYDLVVQDMFDPGRVNFQLRARKDKLSRDCLERFTFVSAPANAKSTSQRSWPPVSLSYALRRCVVGKGSLPFRAAACDLLDELKTCPSGSTRPWQVAHLVALLLRMEALHVTQLPQYGTKLLPKGLVDDLVTADVAVERDFVRGNVESLREYEPPLRPAVRLADATSGPYDAILAYYPANSGVVLHGFQLHKRDELLPAPEGVVSLIMCGTKKPNDQEKAAAERHGWIVISRAQSEQIVGCLKETFFKD